MNHTNLLNEYEEMNTIVVSLSDIDEIMPVYSERKAIVIESTALFIPYLDVLLHSITNTISNNNRYDIIVLTEDIKDIDCKILLGTIYKYRNISLRFFNPTTIIEDYKEKNNNKYLTINYFRLALPWILKKYKIALNLGADLVINKDISDLLNIELSDKEYIAGVRDLGYIGRVNMKDIPVEELGMIEPNQYINADVLLLNLDSIRRDFTLDKVMQPWSQYKLRCAEQDAFNMLFDCHKHILDMRWNYFPERMTSIEHIVWVPKDLFREWIAASKQPYIVHFAAVPKPWDYPTVAHGYKWWKIARESVYYEEIVRRMSVLAVKSELFAERETFGRRFLNCIIPHGTMVRKGLSKLFPKKSIQREALKRIYYLFFKNRNPEWNKKFGKIK